MKPSERLVDEHHRIDLSSNEQVIVPDNHGSVQASQADAAWFAAHPGINERVRSPTLGEVATLPIGVAPDWVVIVRQIFPGARLRQFRRRRDLVFARRAEQ